MESMTVYRVEHGQYGFGPYSPPPLLLTSEEENLRLRAMCGLTGVHHPSPWEDGLGSMAVEEFSCFTRLADLHEWFDADSLDLLAGAGFHVYLYEVSADRVRRGSHQAVFVRGGLDRTPVAATLCGTAALWGSV